VSSPRRQRRLKYAAHISQGYLAQRAATRRILFRELGPVVVLLTLALIALDVYLIRHVNPWLGAGLAAVAGLWVPRRLLRAARALDEFLGMHLGLQLRTGPDRRDQDEA
jgi:hypothetical protein